MTKSDKNVLVPLASKEELKELKKELREPAPHFSHFIWNSSHF